MFLIKENKILKPFENHPIYNCKITTDDGQEYLVYANWIHNEKLDNWQGWHCDAGHTRFYIDKNFDIKLLENLSNNLLIYKFNIFSEDWKMNHIDWDNIFAN